MKKQNYKNHSRYVLGFHIVAGLAIIALWVGSLVNLVYASKEQVPTASLICLIALIVSLLFWYCRSFPLRAQDRVIRAEENFRHYILMGKPLPAGLRMSQVIALRFASDEEFPALVTKALEEKLSSKAIKMAIKDWRGDYYRV